MSNVLIQTLGWVGTSLFVIAYYLISNKKLSADSKQYQWMNLIGAVCLGINVYYQRAWPALGLEVVWAAIAVAALLRK